MLSLARLLYPFGDRRLAQPAGTISVLGCTFSPSSCSSPPPRPVTDPLSPGVVIAGGCVPDWERVCARPGGWRVSALVSDTRLVVRLEEVELLWGCGRQRRLAVHSLCSAWGAAVEVPGLCR